MQESRGQGAVLARATGGAPLDVAQKTKARSFALPAQDKRIVSKDSSYPREI